jgi:RES domain-containing protein
LTPEDRELSRHISFSNRPFILYRLARSRYANLSGAGAAVAPGRWNKPGQEAIYTSTENGVPVLERLVHTPKEIIPSNLAMMEIEVSGEWEEHANAFTDPRTGGCIWFCGSIAKAREFFHNSLIFQAMNPFAVAVPSVIVPVWNVVLFPGARGFWRHVSLRKSSPSNSIPDCSPRTRRQRSRNRSPNFKAPGRRQPAGSGR